MAITRLPKNLRLDKKAKKDYWDILVRKAGPFKGKEYWEVFAHALAIGYKHECKLELKGGEGTIPERTIRDKENLFALMKAIAVIEEGVSVLVDERRIAQIAEEYANGGIKMLYKDIFGSDPYDPLKLIETRALKALRKE